MHKGVLWRGAARARWRREAAPVWAFACLAMFLTLPLPAEATIWPTSGWPPATPPSMGMDSTLLVQARDYAVSQGGGSGIITRGGHVVLSWGSLSTTYELKSATKSVGAMLLGIAIEDGLVQLSDRALDHYAGFGVPPASNQSTGWLDDITLQMLATHAGGFDKPGGFIDLIHAPGTTWAYSDGGANWLADVLTVRYGQDLRSVLTGRVLTRLGISSSALTWRDNIYRGTTIEGIPRREFGSGINANVDAMARLGYLHLRGGTWDGTSILPASFVNAVRVPVPGLAALPVASPATYPNASRHYGLLWWNNGDGTIPGLPTDAYWAWGLGESVILVIPSLDIVAARAGGGWQPDFTSNYSVVAPFFTPIAQSVTGPPSNQAPSANAGNDRTLVLPQTTLTLDGTAADDGLPSGTLTTTWSQVSGPGVVAFSDASALKPTASFPSAGTYVLRLTASDGALASQDEVQVTLTSAPSLVAHWTFDEGSGGTAQSSAGGGYAGTLTNGAQWGVGKLDDAVQLDGVDDWVQVSDPGAGSALDLGSSFTLATWVRFDALPSTGASRNPRIVQKSASTGDAGSYYLSVRTSTGAPVVSLRVKFGGTTFTLDGVQSLAANRWYHVGAVKEGGSVRLYVDGVQDGVTHAVPAGAPDAGNGALYIGESPSNSDGSLDGLVDDLRIYAVALTPAEVLALASPEPPQPDTTPPTKPAGVVATAPSGTQIQVTWGASSDGESGVAHYVVSRNGVGVGTATGTAYLDGGLSPGATYTYVVTAVNGAGLSSEPSDPAQATTPVPTNQAPVVSAGVDQTLTLPASTATLDGTAADDGLPSGSLTTTWSQVSGPGVVAFSDASALKPTASFPSAGTYVLRLTASDGALASQDEMQVLLNPEPPPPPPTALFRSYLTFDGAGDFAQMNDPGSGSGLDLGASFTLAAWVRFDVLPKSGAGRNPRIVQKSASTADAGSYYLSVRTQGSPVQSLRLKFAGNTMTLDGAQALDVNRWYHVAAVKQGTSVRLYLDGVQDGPTHTVPSGPPDAGNAPLYLGESPANSDGSLDGSVEDLRIYGVALTASEIQATKDHELVGSEAGLVFYVPLNEAAGQSLTSLAPGAIGGTLGASMAAESTDPVWAADAAAARLDETVLATSAADSRVSVKAVFEIERSSSSAIVTFAIHSMNAAAADLDIFDVHGRRVKRLLRRVHVGLGSTRVLWDGSADSGRRVASGLYLARLRVGDETVVARVLIRR